MGNEQSLNGPLPYNEPLAGNSPQLITNTFDKKVISALNLDLQNSNEFIFSVAFITHSAISMLKQQLRDYPGSGTIITSDYQNFNHPDVFRELLKFSHLQVRIFTGVNFHPKGYVFRSAHTDSVMVGSSNFTRSALSVNHEWNVQFSSATGSAFAQDIRREISYQLQHSVPLTDEWIDHYEQTYHVEHAVIREHTSTSKRALTSSEPILITPNAMQQEALKSLQQLRNIGEDKALIISATGTGKTILSALDVKSFGPRKMLYIAHREGILDKASEEFQNVLGLSGEHIGKYTGAEKQVGERLTFATIQTLSRPENLAQLDAKTFDYILIDEVHRAGAETYQRIIDHFEPAFLLGMTATPERTDGVNIFELFDHNVAFEIRLNHALEEGMVSPFHYYGVTDYTTDEGEIVDEVTDLKRLVLEERVEHLLKEIDFYRQEGVRVRGLIFCQSVAEAYRLSEMLNQRSFSNGVALKTLALSGENSQEERENAIQLLEEGAINYILTYDIFNEGIDIPSVNQVVMMRQTKSPIVFVQQLGRGLRNHPGKESLIVIDFIGNYKNNYMIPIALFGDTSLNKDSLRKKLVESQQTGLISGISTVSFDQISRQRIFDSIESTTLDTMKNLKETYLGLKYELNRIPLLQDFVKLGSVDPIVIATKTESYIKFVEKVEKKSLFDQRDSHLYPIFRLISHEFLNGKRPHELLLLKELLIHQTLTQSDIVSLYNTHHLSSETRHQISALRTLQLDFFQAADRKKYGSSPLILQKADGTISINPNLYAAYIQNATAKLFLEDMINTGLTLSSQRYDWTSDFKIGEKYSRKDAARLLGFLKDTSSTIYGYRINQTTQTCPIFVTYHKEDDISASTKYHDHFISPEKFHWYSRSKRTLGSKEVQQVLDPNYEKHLFIKKDNAEGDDFYYLGTVHPESEFEDIMTSDSGKPISVVRMDFKLEHPVEFGLYEYLINNYSE